MDRHFNCRKKKEIKWRRITNDHSYHIVAYKELVFFSCKECDILKLCCTYLHYVPRANCVFNSSSIDIVRPFWRVGTHLWRNYVLSIFPYFICSCELLQSLRVRNPFSELVLWPRNTRFNIYFYLLIMHPKWPPKWILILYWLVLLIRVY
jgi:hypothetical protein